MKTQEVIEYAFTFAEAISSPHFHKTSFRVRKKIFTTLDEKARTIVIKLDEIDQSVFSDMGGDHIYPVPGGWGKKGWTVAKYDHLGKKIIKDLIKISYCNVAPLMLTKNYK